MSLSIISDDSTRQAEYNTLKADYDALQANHAATCKKLDETVGENTNLVKDLLQLQRSHRAEFDRQELKLRDRKAENSTLNDELSKCQNDLGEAIAKLEDLEGVLHAMQEDDHPHGNDTASRGLAEAKTEIKDLMDALGEAHKHRRVLESDLEESEANNRTLAANNRTLAAKNEDLCQEIDESKAEVDSLRAEKERYDSVLKNNADQFTKQYLNAVVSKFLKDVPDICHEMKNFPEFEKNLLIPPESMKDDLESVKEPTKEIDLHERQSQVDSNEHDESSVDWPQRFVTSEDSASVAEPTSPSNDTEYHSPDDQEQESNTHQLAVTSMLTVESGDNPEEKKAVVGTASETETVAPLVEESSEKLVPVEIPASERKEDSEAEIRTQSIENPQEKIMKDSKKVDGDSKTEKVSPPISSEQDLQQKSSDVSVALQDKTAKKDAPSSSGVAVTEAKPSYSEQLQKPKQPLDQTKSSTATSGKLSFKLSKTTQKAQNDVSSNKKPEPAIAKAVGTTTELRPETPPSLYSKYNCTEKVASQPKQKVVGLNYIESQATPSLPPSRSPSQVNETPSPQTPATGKSTPKDPWSSVPIYRPLPANSSKEAAEKAEYEHRNLIHMRAFGSPLPKPGPKPAEASPSPSKSLSKSTQASSSKQEVVKRESPNVISISLGAEKPKATSVLSSEAGSPKAKEGVAPSLEPVSTLSPPTGTVSASASASIPTPKEDEAKVPASIPEPGSNAATGPAKLSPQTGTLPTSLDLKSLTEKDPVNWADYMNDDKDPEVDPEVGSESTGDMVIDSEDEAVNEEVQEADDVEEDVDQNIEINDKVRQDNGAKEEVQQDDNVKENVHKDQDVKDEVEQNEDVEEDAQHDVRVEKDLGQDDDVKGDVTEDTDVKEDARQDLESGQTVQNDLITSEDVRRDTDKQAPEDANVPSTRETTDSNLTPTGDLSTADPIGEHSETTQPEASQSVSATTADQSSQSNVKKQTAPSQAKKQGEFSYKMKSNDSVYAISRLGLKKAEAADTYLAGKRKNKKKR